MMGTEITIHTDGSCLGNPGQGGCAAVVRRYEGAKEVKKRVVQDSQSMTTNNRMEMTAAILGLRQIKRDEKAPITVLSDSQLLVRGMNEWLPKWVANDWCKAGRKLVENRALWEELLVLSNGLDVRWQWVRGHAGDPRNEEVDTLAFAAANNAS